MNNRSIPTLSRVGAAENGASWNGTEWYNGAGTGAVGNGNN